jgi:hypothetical protein
MYSVYLDLKWAGSLLAMILTVGPQRVEYNKKRTCSLAEAHMIDKTSAVVSLAAARFYLNGARILE